MKNIFAKWVIDIQNEICSAIESEVCAGKFVEDRWIRKEGGGGITKIMKNDIIEKGGVNTSQVFGVVTEDIKKQLNFDAHSFFATGISLVIHPSSPRVPTVHANYRFFELYDDKNNIITNWFGGGADLTPYVLDKEDAKHFHLIHKKSCDQFDKNYYPEFKKNCDNYFVNFHRNKERRGIGGIFYDYQKSNEKRSNEDLFNFAKSNGKAFIDAYIPIIKQNKDLKFTEQQKDRQLVRRGRYVEFNLIHDRGTIFGLKSNGRSESILMSLPLYAKFDYDYNVTPNSEESELQDILLNPIDWI